jgi:hypothetical protein
VALSGADGALQQFAWLTDAVGEQFAPQHGGVEHVVTDEALKLSGSSRVARKIVRKRTSVSLARLQRAGNDAKWVLFYERDGVESRACRARLIFDSGSSLTRLPVAA